MDGTYYIKQVLARDLTEREGLWEIEFVSDVLSVQHTVCACLGLHALTANTIKAQTHTYTHTKTHTHMHTLAHIAHGQRR